MVNQNSKILVIGLGSMGRRRIRSLQTLGYTDLYGFDLNSERALSAKNEYKILIVNDIKSLKFDCLIISTPPDKHLEYMIYAKCNCIPCFVEASVLLEETLIASLADGNNDYVYPSCTFLFHPIIKDLHERITSDYYGKVTNFSYHSGQYLPDWHPWEDIKDYYVSKKETGGAREIVPFELTWMIKLFGRPDRILGVRAKTGILDNCEIDDTYSFVMEYLDKTASITVDVVSRAALRDLRVNFEKGTFYWNWSDGFALMRDLNNNIERIIPHNFVSEFGYDPNIGEQMYIDELESFFKALNGGRKLYPNSLHEDLQILTLLQLIEN